MERDRQQIIAAFNAHNLHDDRVHAVRVFPSASRRRYSRVEVDLTEYLTHRPRRLIPPGAILR